MPTLLMTTLYIHILGGRGFTEGSFCCDHSFGHSYISPTFFKPWLDCGYPSRSEYMYNSLNSYLTFIAEEKNWSQWYGLLWHKLTLTALLQYGKVWLMSLGLSGNHGRDLGDHRPSKAYSTSNVRFKKFPSLWLGMFKVCNFGQLEKKFVILGVQIELGSFTYKAVTTWTQNNLIPMQIKILHLLCSHIIKYRCWIYTFTGKTWV